MHEFSKDFHAAPAPTPDEQSEIRAGLREDTLKSLAVELIRRHAVSWNREDGTASITLGECSPIAFIREAAPVLAALLGRPVVSAPALREWSGDTGFTAPGSAEVVTVRFLAGASDGASSDELRRSRSRSASRAELVTNALGAQLCEAVEAGAADDPLRGFFALARDGVVHCGPFGYEEYTGLYSNGRHPAFWFSERLT